MKLLETSLDRIESKTYRLNILKKKMKKDQQIF